MSLKSLAQTIAERAGTDPDSSWTARLLANPDKAAEKFGEESVEAIIEATRLAAGGGDKMRLTSEAADTIYHLLVMCAAHGVTLDQIETELQSRTAQSGVQEKANR